VKRADLLRILVAVAAVGVLHSSSGEGDEKPAVDPYADSFELNADVRQFLQAVEQRAYRLSSEATPVLENALEQDLRDAWEATLARDFKGAIPKAGGSVAQAGPVRQLLWTTRLARRDVDRRVFLDWLFGLRARFSSLSHLRVHFERLEPVTRDDLDGPFRGTWTLQFGGTLKEGGQADIEIVCELDFGHVPETPAVEDGWIRACRVVRLAERTTPALLFEDVTAAANIDLSALHDRWDRTNADTANGATSLSSHLFDYDNDGRLDLLLCDRKPALYRGTGDASFEEVTQEAGLPIRSRWMWLGATVADFDNDGLDDILVDVARGTIGRNEAYRNRGDGTFQPLLEFKQPGISVSNGVLADFDNDGLVDIYLPNSGRAPHGNERRVRWIGERTMPHGVLLKNLGNFHFRDVTAEANAGAGFRDIFGAAWLDADLDGDVDLLLANHMGENPLLENLGDGTFKEHVTTRGFGGFSMGLATGDLDGDGDSDAYLANVSSYAGYRIFRNLRPEDYPKGVYPLMRGWFQGNAYYENHGDLSRQGGFVEAGRQFGGWAYSPALGDFDGDGRLDVHCPAGFQSVHTAKPDG